MRARARSSAAAAAARRGAARYRHRLAPQARLAPREPHLPSFNASDRRGARRRGPAMTESPATRAAGGDVGQRTKNGLKTGSNGLLNSLHGSRPEDEKADRDEAEVRGPGWDGKRLGEQSSIQSAPPVLFAFVFTVLSRAVSLQCLPDSRGASPQT